MALKSPAPIKTPKINRTSIKNWLQGTVTAFDDGRTPTDGLRAAGNVMLDQDGTIRPRPSLVRYGTQPPGTILGELFEFVAVNGATNTNYVCAVIKVGGTASLYYAKDGGAWTQATGKTYSTSANAHFCQIDNKVLIMNSSDFLSYLDIPTLAVIPFTALTTPALPTLAQTGLTGTTFTYYYKVTANSTVGETAGSPEASIQVSTQRDLWTPSSEFITVSWTAVPNARSYNVYMNDVSGTEVLLASGINALSFKDDGTLALDVATPAPVGDTTAGPRVTRATAINGQVFLTGDVDNIRYVRFGGTGQSVLDFSPFNGGGWVEVGRGAKEVPVRVMQFRDGKGGAQTTVICQGTNGRGKRYLLTPSSITIGTTIINFFDVTEDNAQDGTNSPDGIILYNDSLWYPSTDGFKTTGTKPQFQNILSTDTVTETIINDVKNLNNAAMSSCVGLAYQERLYWAVPNGSTTNNEIWVLDLARGGAWMKPWTISASWMTLYNDNSGMTHFLVLSTAGVLYELTDSQATNDDGKAFATNITSGLIKFSPDSMEWGKVIDVTFILLRPQGTISITVSGKTEDSATSTEGSTTFTPNFTVAGWGEAGWGGSPDAISPQTPQIFGWSNFTVVPTSFGDAQDFITIEVDDELEWLTYEIDTTTSNTFFQLSDVIMRWVDIGVKSLDS